MLWRSRRDFVAWWTPERAADIESRLKSYCVRPRRRVSRARSNGRHQPKSNAAQVYSIAR